MSKKVPIYTIIHFRQCTLIFRATEIDPCSQLWHFFNRPYVRKMDSDWKSGILFNLGPMRHFGDLCQFQNNTDFVSESIFMLYIKCLLILWVKLPQKSRLNFIYLNVTIYSIWCKSPRAMRTLHHFLTLRGRVCINVGHPSFSAMNCSRTWGWGQIFASSPAHFGRFLLCIKKCPIIN